MRVPSRALATPSEWAARRMTELNASPPKPVYRGTWPLPFIEYLRIRQAPSKGSGGSVFCQHRGHPLAKGLCAEGTAEITRAPSRGRDGAVECGLDGGGRVPVALVAAPLSEPIEQH